MPSWQRCLPSSGLRSATNVVGALPQRQTKDSPAEPIPTILKIGVYNPLSMKRFPVVWVGNVHECSLKPSIGRVSSARRCTVLLLEQRMRTRRGHLREVGLDGSEYLVFGLAEEICELSLVDTVVVDLLVVEPGGADELVRPEVMEERPTLPPAS